MLQNEGFQVEAVAFERDYHRGRLPNCNVTFLGKVKNGQYFVRLFKLLWAIPTIRQAIRRNKAVYALGQDVAFISSLAGLGLGRPVIMEVGDIVGLQVADSFAGRIFRLFDSIVTSRYSLLVVISEGFLNTYYKSWLGISIPSLVIENKLSSADLPKKPSFYRKRLSDEMISRGRPIRIGYFGLLRDDWSWKVLSSLAASHSEKFEIVFAGFPVNPINICELVKDSSNMFYLGEYKSPDQLPEIYNKIDMVWACYPKIKSNDWNLKWEGRIDFTKVVFLASPALHAKAVYLPKM